MPEIKAWMQNCEQVANPHNYKVLLAQEIIERFHDKNAAEKALENFEADSNAAQCPMKWTNQVGKRKFARIEVV